MESDKERVAIKQFDGKADDDFQLWSVRILAYLEGKDLADIVLGERVKPEQCMLDPTDKQSRQYSSDCRKARSILVSALGDRALRGIQTLTCPKEMWTSLQERYASRSNNSRIVTLTNLLNKKLRPNQSIGDHISEFESLLYQLQKMETKIDDQMKVALLLVSISNHKGFESIIAAIKTMRSEDATWNYVTTRLLEEEITMKTESLTSCEAKHVSDDVIAVAKYHKNKDIICHYCKKKGHIASKCFQKARDERNRNKSRQNSYKLPEKARLAMAKTVSSNETKGNLNFAIDSGATEHIACSEFVFESLQDCEPLKIMTADGTEYISSKKGLYVFNSARKMGNILHAQYNCGQYILFRNLIFL